MSEQPRQPSEEELEKLQAYIEKEKQPYVERPRWQIIMAWVLLAIVILGIINICYWQIRG
jgi:hypothetical protein